MKDFLSAICYEQEFERAGIWFSTLLDLRQKKKGVIRNKIGFRGKKTRFKSQVCCSLALRP